MRRRVLIALAFSLTSLAIALGWILRPQSESAPDTAAATPVATATPSPAAVAEPILHSEAVTLRRGDTLIAALVRHGMARAEAHNAAASLRQAGADLRRVQVGDGLAVMREADGAIVGVDYTPSAWEQWQARREESAWQANRSEVAPEIRIEMREGEVRNSLWDAVDQGAVSAQTMLDLVQIFESEFDFAADTQPGDRFRLLVQARYADAKFIEDGAILAARYESSDGALTGIAFEIDGVRRYFDAEGRSLKKMFLRSPLQFTRISSGFTHRRPHPVLGGVRPHLAIDYAAPIGTLVWAVANGSVEFAGHKGGNGIQVLLRHRAGYKTYYNHLSRVAKGMRPGTKVAQKQVIGYVGSTGLSTGPHLDYRVSVNGRFVNPLAERFLPGEPVPPAQRAAFAALARDLVTQLQPGAPTASSPAQPAAPPPGAAPPAQS